MSALDTHIISRYITRLTEPFLAQEGGAVVVTDATSASFRNSVVMIIKVRENEPFEAAMRRFKRAIEKTGLLTELRAREAYEKPTTERKRKHAAACKRHFKRIRSMQLPPKLY